MAHFSRLDPDESEDLKRARLVKPTRTHRLIEVLLFGMFAALLVLSSLALYSSYSPRFKVVPNRVAEGIASDRINLLLIGIGGEEHPGGGKELADSIILVSLKPSTKQVAVISVPRDLFLEIGRYGRHRINRAHVIGNQTAYPGGGPALTMDTVSEIFEQPVHAFVRLDFAAFEKIIDDLGGIDLYVKRGFYDYLFRDGFKAGWHHMDGKRALRYARYRYVNSELGTDFAREERQQQVIRAVRDKLREKSGDDVLSLVSALRTLSSHADTNLTTAQLVWLYRNFKDVSDRNVRYVTLEPFVEIFELRRIADPGEAVRTKSGDFRDLQRLARELFAHRERETLRFAISPSGLDPHATMAIAR